MPYQAAGRKIKSTIKGGNHDGEEGFSGLPKYCELLPNERG